ncbi:MAG: extracellular solute-binding protein [Clostridia bacterium]|nr:extracellular solute-binding protein [Clostridia bacterium]
MKKKVLTKALSLALCAFMTVPAVACSSGGGGGDGEKVDSNKTQLTVFHFFTGFGDEWLHELADNFEEAVKDISFEDGKMGVQIHPKGDVRDFTSGQMKSSEHDVFFLEGPSDFLNIMADGAVEPLDSIIETPNADDNNQTIAEKLTEQQKNSFYYNGHYYGIPHYAGQYGLIYNKDLFDAKGFYLAAEPDEETGDVLISATNPTKSAGPDGITGNEDDGLPRTYDEFFDLCIEIDARGVEPVCFPGMYVKQHLTGLLASLVAAHEGATQMNINHTFAGTAENLVVFNEDGSIKFENGTPVTESLEITTENAWQLARQEGKYYAFDFIQRLLSNTVYYNEDDGENESLSHTENQQNFLENESLGKRPSAMLVDGTWWEIEADDVFSYMTEQDEKYSKQNRKFGWMPLPQPTEEEAIKVASGEKKSVFYDCMNSVACIKAGLPDGVKKAALEFLKYAYTDEALANFTYTTGATMSVDYLDSVDRSKLNYYLTSLVNYIEKSEKVSVVSGNSFYMNKMLSYGTANSYGSGSYTSIDRGVWDGKLSAEDYFIGHQSYYKGLAW